MGQTLTHDMAHDLGKLIDGQVMVDLASRILYSTDASIYQVEPLGVVFPKSGDDLAAIVAFAAKHGVPLLARGSGSSLAGQAAGPALIIDCSKYLNTILEINPQEKRALVEPGVVLNTFNAAAARYGLKFGPDPASSDRATFGGMIGNNSTGAHSIQFGMTSDHVTALDVVLSDGSAVTLEEIPLNQAARLADKRGRLGSIIGAALQIRREFSGAIKSAWPKTWRNSSGYAINYLLPWSVASPPFWQGSGYPPVAPEHVNLAKLFVGSEGTLGVFQRAAVNLVHTPRVTVLGVLAYDSIADASDAAPAILELSPSAVELLPRTLIQRARAVPAYASRLFFVEGDPAALLLVEFEGEDINRLIEQVKGLGPGVIIADTPEKQARIWAVRKVGLGLLMSIPGDTKPIPFVEDVAVPVERLGEFVRRVEKIMADFGTRGDFYAHASSGCLHIRPLVNLKDHLGIAAMRGIAEEFVKLSVSLGGALSGEHGDGQARSEWLKQVYGEQIVSAFEILKDAADPQRLLNPGKVVDPLPMEQNLRYGPDYRATAWKPLLDFSSQVDILGAIEMCNGAGVCRKSGGVMCPSFQALDDEKHSTRGRANLLRAMVSGQIPDRGAAQALTFEALDLCLECKGCKSECPSGVDMAKLKYEFLNHYYQDRRRPLKDYLFGYIGELGKIGRGFGFAFPLLETGFGKRLLQSSLGISRRRKLPRPVFSRADKAPNGQGAAEFKEKVIFLSDPFTEFFYPHLKQDAFLLLDHLGVHVLEIPVIGSGRTLISKGFLEPAKNHASKLLAAIQAADPSGMLPVVGIEPSEVTTLREEFPSFFPAVPEVQSLAERSYLIDEYLVRPGPAGRARVERLEQKGKPEQLLLHGHCYQKAQAPLADALPSGVEATADMLRAAGHTVDVIDSGCCGMAGSFGYEAAHYDLSMQVGELSLFPAVRAKEDGMVVTAPGVSCRAQIESGTDEITRHPVSILAGSIRE